MKPVCPICKGSVFVLCKSPEKSPFAPGLCSGLFFGHGWPYVPGPWMAERDVFKFQLVNVRTHPRAVCPNFYVVSIGIFHSEPP